MSDVPLLWDRLAELEARLSGRRPALFLDYDGTLTPIVSTPEAAHLPAEARAALVAVARRWPVGLVSGRDLADLRARVGIDGVSYAGSHGFDIVTADGRRFQKGDTHAPDLTAAAAALRTALAPVEGALVEAKRFSVAAHTRNVEAEAKPRVAAAVRTIAGDQSRLKVNPGKEVYEVQPAVPWDKGRAVLHLLDVLGLDAPDVLPVFVGDDRTDEDAFAALQGRGVGVLVADAPRPTAATYRVTDSADTVRFLRWLDTRI
ncbi:MAG TPA: trehalose-phosphatase [Azospirillaceae bacterium]|nr:trehalose-phosphatase [Azospirillaceae bacterium]